jgi:glycine C-acetyltransferase
LKFDETTQRKELVMFTSVEPQLNQTLAEIRDAGLQKNERVITTSQQSHIQTAGAGEVVNFCANNYLGLADHPDVIAAAHQALDRWGYGLASVRFICGTQQVHRDLENALSGFLGTDDTILYSSCFDANGGLFETLLGPEDAVISDALNHASIIDGVRLCKAERHRFQNNDMADLEEKLKATSSARRRLIVADGVFSMDGVIARLAEVCDLADRYDAMVMIDDSHSVGFMGAHGRGTHEHAGVMDRVDIITGTLGKALGGASGGYTSGRGPIIDLLRQRSRPYLFSNSLAPVIAATSIRILELIESGGDLRQRLWDHTDRFRAGMVDAGFDVRGDRHPIVPVMIYDAAKAANMADQLLKAGIYVVGFSFPVVPKDQARIRVQLSAAHSTEDVDRAIEAFATVRDQMG